MNEEAICLFCHLSGALNSGGWGEAGGLLGRSITLHYTSLVVMSQTWAPRECEIDGANGDQDNVILYGMFLAVSACIGKQSRSTASV